MLENLLRWFQRSVLVLAVAACSVVLAAPAQAHDVLESSDPANGSSVPAVPSRIGLTFDHTPMGIGSVIQVQDGTGTDQADGAVTIVDNHVTQAVKAGAPAGKYTVIWRVASSDGHPIEGTFTFTAGSGNSGASPSAAGAAAGAGGTPAGVIIAGGAAAVLVIGLAGGAVLVRRRLRNTESDA
ncbi:copper resistance CopC family protein [Arthrobacter sp. MMS24-T111]|uniref:copper resistance CopC family protein n=1 Tax=Arthrobacter sp. 135MFCol5.1 TaxID=1158050 RepID=UPI0003723441|nr:copper resistance CopC family protein [Arthrobacter sp. 135MFCol5.1]